MGSKLAVMGYEAGFEGAIPVMDATGSESIPRFTRELKVPYSIRCRRDSRCLIVLYL